MDQYRKFIASKVRRLKPMGFQCDDSRLPVRLFDWQQSVVRWAVKRGRAALFEECGLGKTLQQLSWADQVAEHTGKPVILHCPVGVRQQTAAEAAKFGIQMPVHVCDSDADIPSGPAICITNYEKLHKLNASRFSGVVLDESSILKSFTGATKRALVDAYSQTPYRLACTATPAPNDYKELGNHAEFLGVMPSNEMLSRWFINDTMQAGGYRLKGHAAADFWQWMTTWAVCLTKPSDLGDEYSDDGYELPPLCREDIIVETESGPCVKTGTLFGTQTVNATKVHAVKRESVDGRAASVADLIASDHSGAAWIVWCDTNYEADALLKRITAIEPKTVEVRGSHTERSKEQNLNFFSNGDARVIITKPDIAGFGLNWQHCSNVAFVGLSYSFEKYYQAVRRSWRFGQTRPVNVYVITTEIEQVIDATVDRKEQQHVSMFASMAEAMKQFQHDEIHGELARTEYRATKRMEVPEWLNA